MLSPDALRDEIAAVARATSQPYNVNFFCHTPPPPDPARDTRWRELLAPYYRELGVEPESMPTGPVRAPFGHDAADVLASFKPPIVSFHFGLPSKELLDRVRAWRPIILSSATTVDEARWLEANGAETPHHPRAPPDLSASGRFDGQTGRLRDRRGAHCPRRSRVRAEYSRISGVTETPCRTTEAATTTSARSASIWADGADTPCDSAYAR